MTSTHDAVNEVGIFVESIDLDDCNPELLKQLSCQENANKQPRILRGCEVTIHKNTVSARKGQVLLPGRYLAVVAAKAIELARAHQVYPRIDSVIVRAYDDELDASGKTGPEIQVITGTPDSSPIPPVLPVSSIQLALVFVSDMGPPMLYEEFSPELEAAAKERAVAKKKREESCLHVGVVTVNSTRLGDPEERYDTYCRGCGMYRKEWACGRCGKRNPESQSCHCRH